MRCRAATSTGDRCHREAEAGSMPEMCSYHWNRKQSGKHVPFVAYWNVSEERENRDVLLRDIGEWFQGEVAAGDTALQHWVDRIAAVRER